MDTSEIFANPGAEVLVAGDWHIDDVWGAFAIERAAELGVKVILHVGDFGFWSGDTGVDYLAKIQAALEAHDMLLLVTPGNHDNYDLIESWPLASFVDGRVSPDADRVIALERGAHWDWAGKRFLSVGGGATIDKHRRTQGVSFWPQELITAEDVVKANAAGRADVLITHDVQQGVNMFGSHRLQPLPMQVQLYVDESRSMVKAVTDVARPQIHFHGHYHVERDEVDTMRVNGEYEFYTTRTVCMDKERTKGNTGLLSLDSLGFSRVSFMG